MAISTETQSFRSRSSVTPFSRYCLSNLGPKGNIYKQFMGKQLKVEGQWEVGCSQKRVLVEIYSIVIVYKKIISVLQAIRHLIKEEITESLR